MANINPRVDNDLLTPEKLPIKLTAINMLKNNIHIKLIASIIGLIQKEICNLKIQNNNR